MLSSRVALKYFFLPCLFVLLCIPMSHFRPTMVDGAEFWISSKLSAFPSSFGHLQVIQNSASMWCPNVLWFRQLIQIRWNYPSSFSFLTHKMFNHHSAWINYFARIHWHSRITYEACFCIAGAFIMYLFIFFSRYGIEARKKSEMTRLAL